ncbi:MAG TPA: phospholipid carrier-dependent glycosyltransferase [Terriglobales bacterium]|nr:phospholipid carrier-dependent glycosyltransferase [Terriglobales bacterium]
MFAIATGFTLVGLMLFLFGIKKPAAMFYDEGYFVPEARVFIHSTTNPRPQEKPPLGKMILAMGIKAAGDNPLGWRVGEAVFGAMTLPAVFFWTYLLVRNLGLACLATGLTLLNNFLFVMSRIGMVDTFFIFFLIWSLVAFTAALVLQVSVGRRRFLFCSAGVFVGLASSCKWNGVDTLTVLVLVTLALRWIAAHPMSGVNSSLSVCANKVKEIGLPILILGLTILPVIAYCLTYWPLCHVIHRPFSVRELVAIHHSIWHFNSTTISNPFITTPWYLWPLKLTPERGLSYLMGNPVITWGGLLAMGICMRRLWRVVTLQEGMVFLLFAANYFQWAVTPEKGLFYYYYYPCVMILGVTIAVAMRGLPSRIFGLRISLILLLAAAVIFLRCYPRMMHLDAPWDCALGCWV